jgi:hypothetical protein
VALLGVGVVLLGLVRRHRGQFGVRSQLVPKPVVARNLPQARFNDVC